MEPSNINWLPQLFETIRILVVAIIPVLILIYQHKSKKLEKKFEIQFKAKEYLFESYQNEIKESNDSIKEFNSAVGKLIGTASSIKDSVERLEYYSGIKSAINMIKPLMLHATKTAENELRENELLTPEYLENLGYVNEILAIDIQQMPSDKTEKLLSDFMMVNIILNLFDKSISRKKRDNLFKGLVDSNF